MQLYIRDAVGTDLPAIGAILRDNGLDGSGDALRREALAEIDRTDGSYVLVAEYDSQIVAALHLVVFRRLDAAAGKTAQITLLAVANGFRTSGVHEKLIDHAAGRASDIGCRELLAFVGTSDADEHPRWERAGFVHLQRGYVRRTD